jgi:hypothetical protein
MIFQTILENVSNFVVVGNLKNVFFFFTIQENQNCVLMRNIFFLRNPIELNFSMFEIVLFLLLQCWWWWIQKTY